MIFQLVAQSKVGFNSSRLLFLSLRGGRELPGLFGVCTELRVHGAVHVAMALRTLGGEMTQNFSCRCLAGSKTQRKVVATQTFLYF